MSASAAFDMQRLPGVSAGVYSSADFDAVRALVHAEAGIVLAPGKAMLVYSRLAPRVRDTGSGTFARYIERIRAEPEERRRAIDALTTNHTFFFREGHHFDHLAAKVRPGLVARADAGDPVRIWSAGCSSGEETWSIVMTLLGNDRERGRALARRDVVVLATDIASHALAAGRAANYPAAALEAAPDALRRLWTTAGADGATEIDAVARGMVRFRTLNLLGDWPIARTMDVIFCRNVMIYFDNPTKERLVHRFAQTLAPGGHLYIGHSERVTGAASSLLTPVGPTIYQRNAA